MGLAPYGSPKYVDRIKEQSRIHSHLDGLIVLIDACSWGEGEAGAPAGWLRALSGTLRSAALIATDDRSAADGWFTKALVECLSEGMASVHRDDLGCTHVRGVLREKCPRPESHLAGDATPPGGALWAERQPLRPSDPPLGELDASRGHDLGTHGRRLLIPSHG